MAYAPAPPTHPAQLQPAQIMAGPIAPPQLLMAPNGSIRSVQSVPMLAAAAAAAAAPPQGNFTFIQGLSEAKGSLIFGTTSVKVFIGCS